MATFTVDPTSLQALAGTLGGLCGQMEAMPAVASGFEGLLGGRALEGEVEHFCSNWDYGIGLLQQHMQHVVQNLGKAAATYSSSEQHVADACRH
ncbi:MAG TPA: hypothetical protein VG365_03455 [Solirubrobacteraceae bacterium]|jgi:hypothetical protein|nr:hypothetical protein [Solirubrobacteraceae bacterium]